MAINNSKSSRSRNLDDKPTAKEQLKKHPNAFALCTMTIEYLESIYTGTPFCGWNNKTEPSYLFGSKGKGMLSVRPRSRTGEHALVRISEVHENVPGAFKDSTVTHGPRVKGEERSEGVAFTIRTPEDLHFLNQYLSELNYARFNKPNAVAWKGFKALVDESIDTITKHYRKAIEEGFSEQREENLKRTFNSWLEKKGMKNIITEDDIHKNHIINQRKSYADVIFESRNSNIKILTELKFTKDTRADIEKSFGQLLRYKYYGEGYSCDELWTVSGHQPTSIDIAWVDNICEVMKLNYRLAWLEDNGNFEIYPSPDFI